MFDKASVFITGGTGSFGTAFVRYVLKNYKPRRLVIFSRDELKQFEMQSEFSATRYPCIRYFLGDVRDGERLKQAMSGIDFVIHTAALKQVPAAEYNPLECIKTNINGAENVINAAIYNRVKRVIALSTDKAANPINLYGATKLVADKVFVSGNSMSGEARTRFSVVRYGNVINSRGSVIPVFLNYRLRKEKVLPITDQRMTRFWITLTKGVQFVIQCFERMRGGEIFVPKIPSMRIVDVAKAICPEADIQVTGIRPGEKIHEVLVSAGDAHNTLEFDDHYVIQPVFHWWDRESFETTNGGKRVPDGFEYSSDKNKEWLTPEQLLQWIDLPKSQD